MSEHAQSDDPLAHLPEAFVIEIGPNERRRVTAPTYEALTPCQIVMQSAETGLTGPTRVEAGEVFTTEATPCHAWVPLNRAAGERYQAWVNSLPASGEGLSMQEITEAAMMMRPREGEPELPHEQWFPAVLKLAAKRKEMRSRTQMPLPRAATDLRAGRAAPVMPFAATGPVVPVEVGRGPVGPHPHEAYEPPAPTAARSARRAGNKPQSPMPGAAVSDAPAQATG